MDMYERDLRDLLEWKIARYRALAREASDDQTARRIQALVRELMADLILWDATIVDARSSSPQRRMSITMRGGKIAEVCKADHQRPGDEAIDLGGAYVVPGLIDAHIHLGDDPAMMGDLAVPLAMRGEAPHHRELVYFVLAILIKLDSTGPVFFVHPAVGRSGSEFVLYKFRSMLPASHIPDHIAHVESNLRRGEPTCSDRMGERFE